MVELSTPVCDFGKKPHDFNLLGVDGSYWTLEKCMGKNGLLVMFICNHCPYVIHVIDEIINIANDYQKKGISFVAISSNDVINYPEDDPSKMKLFAQDKKFPFPYLYDESQKIAKDYDAACTPDFSVFDKKLKCIYRGQMDNARPKNDSPNDGKDLRKVLDYTLENKEIDFEQKPSLGCNIKWK